MAVLGGSLVLWLAVGVSLGNGVLDPTAPVAAPTTTSGLVGELGSTTTSSSTTTTAPPVDATLAAPPPVDAPPVPANRPVADSPTGPSRIRTTGRTPPVVGRIVVPSLGIDTTAYDGGDLAQIDWGPSHMPNTAYPGHLGNTVFAGHRVTKTHPFRDLDRLQPGDRVIFHVGDGTYQYSFTHFEVVDEDGVQILQQRNAYEATLFACHPPGSDQYRIVAHFTMVNPPRVTPTTTPGGGTSGTGGGSGGSTTPTTKPKPIQLPKR